MKDAEKIAGKWIVEINGTVNELPAKYNYLLDSFEAITQTKNHDLAVRKLMDAGYSKTDAELGLQECYKENRKAKTGGFVILFVKALFWLFMIAVVMAAFEDGGVFMYGLLILALIGVAKNGFYMLFIPFNHVKHCESPLEVFNLEHMIKSQ
jgi:hypothetical protein